eukprot:7451629-Pyramimonas_sp.AAC.1
MLPAHILVDDLGNSHSLLRVSPLDLRELLMQGISRWRATRILQRRGPLGALLDAPCGPLLGESKQDAILIISVSSAPLALVGP